VDCPRCHTPLKPAAKQGVLRDVLAVFGLGNISAQKPNLRCPQCRTEVAAPREDGPVLSVDHLEDYRKLCWQQWKASRAPGLQLGAIPPEYFAEQVARLERVLRFLEALTLEERLQPERVGDAERERAMLASGATAEDVEELFEQFTETRNFFRNYREKKLPGQRYVWLGMVLGVGAFAAGVGAGVWAQHNSVVATILHVLGYSLVGLVVVFACLGRVKGAVPLVFSSWRRICLLAFVVPALGVGLHLLLHEWVVQVGLEPVPRALGCFTLVLLLIVAYAWISTELVVRRVVRDVRATAPAAHADREAQARP
jgi:hypothetical protein